MRNLFFAAVVLACSSGAAQGQLINGNFEGSSDPTSTPPGWTNIGHADGVIAYSAFATPAYDGDYYYDLGGYGSPPGPIGDGIMQTVSTIAGQTYAMTFGYTGENGSGAGASQLTVMIGGSTFVYDIVADASGLFKKPFTTTTIDYLADSASTIIKFIETGNPSGGNNDPLIDRVSFDGATMGGVPEPATWAMMLIGFAMTGATVRHRRKIESMSLA